MSVLSYSATSTIGDKDILDLDSTDIEELGDEASDDAGILVDGNNLYRLMTFRGAAGPVNGHSSHVVKLLEDRKNQLKKS